MLLFKREEHYKHYNSMKTYFSLAFLFLFSLGIFSDSFAMQKDRGEEIARAMKYFPVNVLGVKPSPDLNDRNFLLYVAKDTWRFFDNSVYLNTGFIPDKIFIKSKNAAHFTSITNIGLYMLCVYQAQQLGFISREDAVERIGITIKNLLKLEKYEGFYYNWYEIDVMKPSDKYISTVDSGWLYACLWIIGNAYQEEFGNICHQIIDSVDFNKLYDPKMQAFSLGLRPGQGLSPYHYKMLCSEARIAFYQAVLQKQINPCNWFNLSRTLDSTYDQYQKPKGSWRKYDTISYFNGFYKYNDIEIVPSWGGSIFEFLMPGLLVDERISEHGMGENNRRVVASHKDYALNKLKYPVWGLSPCATPYGGYEEYGVPDLGSAKSPYKNGIVSPHASILALNYAKDDVILNMKNMLRLYPVYGEYGFYDCIKIDSSVVGDTYLALDQAMIFLSIANYLTDNAMPKLYMKNKEFSQLWDIIKKDEFYK